jgi:hypothetical protein
MLRAVFIDGQSSKAVDFASNLVAFALRLRNASLDDHGLLIHLSESLQGALSGVGHSSIYNESAIYRYADSLSHFIANTRAVLRFSTFWKQKSQASDRQICCWKRLSSRTTPENLPTLIIYRGLYGASSKIHSLPSCFRKVSPLL